MSYFAALQQMMPDVKNVLRRKGVESAFLAFGDEGAIPERLPRVPTDAQSEFLANRAMGDWAEEQVWAAMERAFPEWSVHQFGNSDRIAAGDSGFRDHFLSVLEETRRFGKRPDQLVFPRDLPIEGELAAFSPLAARGFARHAVAALEVRSSKFDADTYMRVRRAQRAAGKRSVRESPSFTVKVEDLVIVYRWLEQWGTPQTYCQVFFDSIWALNFLEIFRTVASGVGFTIEAAAKNQNKATIMIPITAGHRIGTATAKPTFAARHRVTQLGRYDAYVVPSGGRFDLDAAAARAVLLPAT